MRQKQERGGEQGKWERRKLDEKEEAWKKEEVREEKVKKRGREESEMIK